MQRLEMKLHNKGSLLDNEEFISETILSLLNEIGKIKTKTSPKKQKRVKSKTKKIKK